MTNEDALFFLTHFRTTGINEHLYEALGVAISAFKQPEIIYCRECKHSDGKKISDGRYWCDLHKYYMRYCSDAERREE